MPPMVTPQRYPSDIMDFEMSMSDRELMNTHLDSYQRSGIGWDEYRKKIPTPLLDKWAKVQTLCRKQGFILPKSYNGEIKFKQILTNRKTNMADKCTLCPRNVTNGSCEGYTIEKGAAKIFIPCWFGGN